MQRNYAEYGTETRIVTYRRNWYLFFSVYSLCAEYEFETFGSTSDQIRLMALIQMLLMFVLKQYIQQVMKLV